jgi:hypothetical protein
MDYLLIVRLRVVAICWQSANREWSWKMKSKFYAGKNFAVWVCMTLVACVSVKPLAAQIPATPPAVLQVPAATRVAGNTTSGYNGDYGSAINLDLNSPVASVFDAAGNQYISDTKNNCVRKVTPGTPAIMSVLVGYESAPTSSDTCNASSLTPTPTQGLLGPQGLAIDAAGNLFIADGGHNCIRELPANTTGTRSLINVVDTCLNYGSPAAAALSVSPNPQGLLLDANDNEFWTSYEPSLGLSQVMYHRQQAPAELPTNVCDVVGTPVAGHDTVCTFYNGQGIVLNDPTGLVIDAAGDYYVADTGNGCVREVSAALGVSTPMGQCASDGSGAGNPSIPNFAPVGLAAGNQGYLYVTNIAQGTVLQYQGLNAQGAPTAPVLVAGVPNSTTPYTGAQDGKAAVVVSLNQPAGLSVDPSGNLYVADSGNGIIRELTYNNQFPSENLHTPSGGQNLQFEINANVNLSATFTAEYGVSLGNNTCTGPLTVSTGATPTTCVVSVAFTPLYPGPRRAPLTLTDSSSTPPTSYQFGLSGTGIGSNALFIPGTIQTQLASLGNPTAVVVGTAQAIPQGTTKVTYVGNVYFAESGGAAGSGDIQEIAAGSTTATVLVPAGKIQAPVALALDAAQNLYVADSATNSIYKVDANANVTTFAAGLNSPVALAVDNYGNVYVAQNGSGAAEVLKIFAGGQQQVVAGGGTNPAADSIPATQAQFIKPSGLYVDASGVMYISDEAAFRVYSVDTTGTIHYFAGNGTQSNSQTPPTLPTEAGLVGPTSVVGDAAGDIYITDGAANLIYVVFGGSNQNPGIEPLVGTGLPCTAAPCGDGGAASLAELNNPVSVALDGAEDLFLVDAGTNSIREVNYQSPTLDFGYVKPGNSSGPLTTQLWDAGNQQPGLNPLTNFPPVENDSTGITNAFTQVSDGCGQTLPTGSTCALSYSFTAPYNPPAAPIYGQYEAQAASNASAVNIPQVINLVANVPQITFITPPITAVYGTSYALTASVTDAGGPPPTGTVTFAITGTNAQTLCGGPINLSPSGSVSCPSTSTPLNVGTYPVLVSYSGDGTYLAATQTTTLTITPAPVVITAANFTRPYNTPNPTFTYTVSPATLPAGQTITDTLSTTATQASAPGTYPIVLAQPATAGPGTLLSNYAITYNNGTLTITKNSGGVSISSPAVSTVYGTPYTIASSITSANTPAPTGTATFTIGSQVLCTAAPVAANGTVACSPSPTLENVGSYSVNVAYSGDTFYPASSATIALTISPAPVTITAANASRPFGTPNPTLTGTVSGVVAGQSITDTYTTTAVQTSAPGSYPITPVQPATGGAGTLITNYAITYVPGTLTVTLAGGPSFSTPAVTTVYGSAYTLAATITSGLTPAPTGTVSFTLGGQALCPTSVLGANGTVTCTPSPTLENAGSYEVSVTYSGDQNYPSSSSSLALTITPAPVKITANNTSRTTGVPNPTFTGAITGVVAGQSITATYSSPATIASPAGNYPIIATPVIGPGTLASNYTITVVNGILTITQSNTPPPTSPTGSFTLTATPPEQEIDNNGSVKFPVTLTSVDGFTDSVSFSCSGLPEGVGCTFSPGTLIPAAGGSSITVMTITGTADGTNVPSNSFGALRPASSIFGGSPDSHSMPLSSLVLAWTMLPVGFTGSAASLLMGFKRRKGGKKAAVRSVLWIVPVLLFMAGLAGCGSPNNYKIYTVTITATDSTYATPVSQSTTVQLVLAK